MQTMNRQITSRLQQINLLLLDVDGVLTDGMIIYDDSNMETKMFSVKDGMGIRLLMDNGIQVGIVTGRASSALRHRCKNLGINLIFDGIQDKAQALGNIMQQTGKVPQEIAFVGDDLPDLPIMNRVGLSIAVADAHDYVRDQAVLVTSAGGGKGAVREICEAILKAKGLWDNILNTYK
jgi:3-deoxy-D-manno-octulosonate 8-phosphate phosphatase (KDO 8-P phosphatase)